MGMAWKLDPAQIKTTDIWETSVCPLARLVRLGLKKRGFSGHFTVVYSAEKPGRGEKASAENGGKKAALGSAMPVTAAAGMLLASLVIRDICGKSANSVADSNAASAADGACKESGLP
jgi:tRNA A37 threonylcarbamoyladenosine dehydratase